MQKILKTQKLMAEIAIAAVLMVLLYTLCFMTEYKDLFGLKLAQNEQISFFHDAVLQRFNGQIFSFALVGIFVILLSFLLELFEKIPDRFALVVMILVLIICCCSSVYAIRNIGAIEQFYGGLDFQYLQLEGINEYIPRVTTFRVGVAVYTTHIICCIAYGMIITISHVTFLRAKRKGVQ